MTSDPDTAAILNRVAAERTRQRDQWGNPHDDAHSPGDWLVLVVKWTGKIAGHLMDPPNGYGQAFLQELRGLFVKLAAVSVAAAEVMNRKLNGPSDVDGD
ncbi:MAG: hypothetical protein OXC29_22420 [Rhodococcus sp.]|nr:hypothetical protein [Rhodococcus sp. (in: high G+C Gram-positive bacteria)]